MPSFDNKTGNFFPNTDAGRLEDLQQSVIDRVLTRIGTRPYDEGYGSLFYLFGRISTGRLAESIENAMRTDPRVEQIFIQAQQNVLNISVNQNQRFGTFATDPKKTIDDTVYQSLLDIIQQAFDGEFNLRVALSPENAPIWFIRDFTDTTNLVPSTQLLGETFERRVYDNWYDFFSLRDKEAIIQLYARLAEMQYTATFDRDTGDLELCFTPSPFRLPPDSLFLEELRDACKWMLPHYENRMNVVFCIFQQESLYTNTFAVNPWGRIQYLSF